MRVCVLTTSYPRSADDIAGIFVAEQVEHLRRAGHEVDVVSPADFRHYGIAFGGGIVQNLRRRPWLAALLPLFLASFVRAARRTARTADVVHAHWLPSGLVGLATRRPVLLQVWGTDVELARRAPWLARPLLRRSAGVVAASSFLAGEARALGAPEVRVVPNGVELPPPPGPSEEPPHVLFVGRLSEEKGILELLEAAQGLPLTVVGDGPLRSCVPQAAGFVPHAELGPWYDRAAVVCVPSRREGYGVVAREAMAHGRPVVATRVGGLPDAVEDEVTGLLVPLGDAGALRDALERLLADPAERLRLGAAARAAAEERYSWTAVTAGLVEALEAARRTT